MRAHDELSTPNSCINSALPDEMCFVLLGRDESAVVALRAWIEHRVRSGKNKPTDDTIIEAHRCLDIMVAERAAIRKELGKI
jgi:hypothetical protein